MIQRIYLFVLLSSFTWTIHSQTADVLDVHFDKDFYVAGEDSWYTIYFTKEIRSIESKVVHVEWLAPNGQMIAQQKLKVVDNYAVGDLAIPYDWTEGNYLFRAYTLWSLNFGDTAIFQKEIPVFNVEASTKILASIDTNKVAMDRLLDTLISSEQISIQFDKERYLKRDSITITIEVKDEKGQAIAANLSAAVFDNNYGQAKIANTFFRPTKLKAASSNKYPIETSLSITGILKDSKKKPLSTQFLSLYFQDSKQFQQTAIKAGQLAFPIADFTGTQRVQLFDMNPFHETLPKVNLINNPSFSSYTSKPLQRSNDVVQYLFLLQKYRQFKEVFQIPFPQYVRQQIPLATQAPIADQTFQTKDYKALSTLASFFEEILLGVRVLKKDSLQTIRLYYKENNSSNQRAPLYLVNGYLTNQEDLVLSMSLRDVSTIEVFDSRQSITQYIDPALVSTGLVVINTKDLKTPTPIIHQSTNFVLNGYYAPRNFPSFIGDTTLPDFRPIVYWQPIIKTDAKGKATIRFAASDGIGSFGIQVKGRSVTGKALETNVKYYVLDRL